MIGIGFNGAETNRGIAHILGILLMNSYDFWILIFEQQLAVKLNLLLKFAVRPL